MAEKKSKKKIESIIIEQSNCGNVLLENSHPEQLMIQQPYNLIKIERSNLTQFINHLISINK